MVKSRTPAKAVTLAASVSTQSLRYVCVHGHFYQPPRENPWLEAVEVEDSAAPYHDWNERVAAECYAPNRASRITNRKNEIVRIVNNYAHMSFNFGPTLLKWLAENQTRTYRTILEADRASAQRYGGHGSAIAQVYNHIILPLASRRDAITQIRWGIADFAHRFGRQPEGMWLSETAVDRTALDLMAAEGIKFTILAPHQCARVRPLRADQPATDDWTPTPNATVDSTHLYIVQLDEGRSIAVFFYNGPASRAIAFEGLLNSGEAFGRRLLESFHDPSPDSPPQVELSHVATDGESYGHHHKYGEMALSYAMQWIEDNGHAKLTNYGEFLEKFPPTWEAEVVEDTSWSCEHGIERWRSNCGCNSGTPGFNQEWRGPLREALDFLRDAAAPLSEALAEPLLIDLWAARDAYIQIILDRSPESKDRFFASHAKRPVTDEERITLFELLELQRNAQLMYSSDGWFFDDVSGIETIQNIAYAGRVLQLAAKLFGSAGAALEDRFLEILARAKSNIPEEGDGARIYRRHVAGMRIGLEQVGAHYAISSIFRSYPEDGELFCFDLHRDSYESFTSGRGKVAIGRAHLRSRITEENEEICFAVLHLGDQNLSAAVRRYSTDGPENGEAFFAFSNDIRNAIGRANLPEVIRLIDRFFGAIAYSLTSLFADEQHRILRTILDSTVEEMEDSLRNIYEDHASLLHFLTESGMAAPPALAIAANFAINARLRRAIEADNFNAAEIESLFLRAATDRVALDTTTLSFAAGERLKRAMAQLETAAESTPAEALRTSLAIAISLHTMPFDVNLWQAQNIWYDIFRHNGIDRQHAEWQDAFKKLGEALYIAVDQLTIEEGTAS